MWCRRCLGRGCIFLGYRMGGKKEMSSNQITIVVVRSEVEEEIELREVDMIHEVVEYLGCYHWVYISLYFIR